MESNTEAIASQTIGLRDEEKPADAKNKYLSALKSDKEPEEVFEKLNGVKTLGEDSPTPTSTSKGMTKTKKNDSNDPGIRKSFFMQRKSLHAMLPKTQLDTDPMEFSYVSPYRYATMFAVIMFTYTSPVIILLASLTACQLTNTIKRPETWMRCAFWFAFFWSPATQAFYYLVVIKAVKQIPGFEHWVPSGWKFMVHCITIGCGIIAVWVGLYYVFGGLIWFHKCFSCAMPTIGGALLVRFVVPRTIKGKVYKDVVIGSILPIVMIFFTAYVYLFVQAIVVGYASEAGEGLVLIFPIARHCMNMMYGRVTTFTNTTELLPILMVVNTLWERLQAMSAVSMTDFNPFFILFTLDWFFTLKSYIKIIAPMGFNNGTWRVKLRMISQYLKLSSGSVKHEPEDVKHIRTRVNTTYYYVNDCFCELLSPFSYMLYYFMLKNSTVSNAIAGFEEEVLGRKKVDESKLYEMGIVQFSIDFLIFAIVLFSLRRRFPKFNPLKTMVVFVEGLGALYPLSIIAPFLTMVSYDFIGTNSDYEIRGLLQETAP